MNRREQCAAVVLAALLAPVATTARSASPSYGAIAYGRRSLAWGYSEQWGSRAKAEGVALQNCGQIGGDCQVVVWYDHRCGAVAADDRRAVFATLGDSPTQAAARAQSACRRDGGINCEVKAAECSK